MTTDRIAESKQTNAAKIIDCPWFVHHPKPMPVGSGKKGHDVRVWARSIQRAIDIGEPVVALEAELLRQWFEAGGKKELSVPFNFVNEVLTQIGVSSQVKKRYLDRMEKAGWIQVKWRASHAPVIRLLKLF